MWRFDRTDDPIAADNFWGHTESQSVESLRLAGNPNAAVPDGPRDVDLAVDVYFPATVASLPGELRGHGAHPGGRNRRPDVGGEHQFAATGRLPAGARTSCPGHAWPIPRGLRPTAQGCEARATLGQPRPCAPTPTGLRLPRGPAGHNLVGVGGSLDRVQPG
jgi:hypothetical protein